jgi:hypothetical protein
MMGEGSCVGMRVAVMVGSSVEVGDSVTGNVSFAPGAVVVDGLQPVKSTRQTNNVAKVDDLDIFIVFLSGNIRLFVPIGHVASFFGLHFSGEGRCDATSGHAFDPLL